MRGSWFVWFCVMLAAPPALAQPDGDDGDAGAAPATAEEAAGEETPAEPTPEQRVEASTRFQKGLAFYREGDFELALIEFERAYDTIPDYRVLYNIGQVCVELGRYARARKALQGYLDGAGDGITEERAREVNADLDMLKSRTAFLLVGTNVEGASVLIDGAPVGQAPLPDALIVDAGEHEVEVRLPGYSGVPQRVTLAGGDRLEVTLELTELIREKPQVVAPPPPAPVVPEPPPPPPAAEPERSSALWAGWATTAALAIGAGTTFALGAAAVNEYESMDDELGLGENDLPDQKRKADNLLLTTDILAASATVAGGVSLYLTLRQRGRARREEADQRGLRLDVGPTRATLVGRF